MDDSQIGKFTQSLIDVAKVQTDVAYIREKIDSICENCERQDRRIDKLEEITRSAKVEAIAKIAKIIGVFCGGLLLAVLGAYLQKVLGL